MEFKETGFDGLYEIFPKVFGDKRGFFFESYQYEQFKEVGIDAHFVQDNQSFSQKGVLRGLHLQKPPYAQGKLVRVITGKALDVAVDLRENSPTYGKSYQCVLDSSKHNMFYIPEGFAHGFLALEDTVFFYKCTGYYHKPSEAGIIWNDPQVNINWGIENPNVSEKDQILPTLDEFEKL